MTEARRATLEATPENAYPAWNVSEIRSYSTAGSEMRHGRDPWHSVQGGRMSVFPRGSTINGQWVNTPKIHLKSFRSGSCQNAFDSMINEPSATMTYEGDQSIDMFQPIKTIAWEKRNDAIEQSYKDLVNYSRALSTAKRLGVMIQASAELIAVKDNRAEIHLITPGEDRDRVPDPQGENEYIDLLRLTTGAQGLEDDLTHMDDISLNAMRTISNPEGKLGAAIEKIRKRFVVQKLVQTLHDQIKDLERVRLIENGGDPRLVPIVEAAAQELVAQNVFKTIKGAKDAIMGVDRRGNRTQWTPFSPDPQNPMSENTDDLFRPILMSDLSDPHRFAYTLGWNSPLISGRTDLWDTADQPVPWEGHELSDQQVEDLKIQNAFDGELKETRTERAIKILGGQSDQFQGPNHQHERISGALFHAFELEIQRKVRDLSKWIHKDEHELHRILDMITRYGAPGSKYRSQKWRNTQFPLSWNVYREIDVDRCKQIENRFYDGQNKCDQTWRAYYEDWENMPNNKVSQIVKTDTTEKPSDRIVGEHVASVLNTSLVAQLIGVLGQNDGESMIARGVLMAGIDDAEQIEDEDQKQTVLANTLSTFCELYFEIQKKRARGKSDNDPISKKSKLQSMKDVINATTSGASSSSSRPTHGSIDFSALKKTLIEVGNTIKAPGSDSSDSSEEGLLDHGHAEHKRTVRELAIETEKALAKDQKKNADNDDLE